MTNKIIRYEDLDRAVKAAYKLGEIDGREDIRNQLIDMQRQLSNMLVTNKHLHEILSEERKEDKAIEILPCFTLNLLGTLRTINRSQFRQLKEKYEEKTGKRCVVRKGKLEVVDA